MSALVPLVPDKSSFYVHIVESPSSEDHFDGHTEGRALCEMLKLSGIRNQYRVVSNRELFDVALKKDLVKAVIDFNALPILHISAHGNQAGIGLTSKEHVSWLELKSYLTPWQRFMQGSLILSLSACHSSHSCSMLVDQKLGPPFYRAIVNKAEVPLSDVAIGFAAFYHRLFRGATPEIALHAMKEASGNPNFEIFDGPDLHQKWGIFIQEVAKQIAKMELEKIAKS